MEGSNSIRSDSALTQIARRGRRSGGRDVREIRRRARHRLIEALYELIDSAQVEVVVVMAASLLLLRLLV